MEAKKKQLNPWMATNKNGGADCRPTRKKKKEKSPEEGFENLFILLLIIELWLVCVCVHNECELIVRMEIT